MNLNLDQLDLVSDSVLVKLVGLCGDDPFWQPKPASPYSPTTIDRPSRRDCERKLAKMGYNEQTLFRYSTGKVLFVCKTDNYQVNVSGLPSKDSAADAVGLALVEALRKEQDVLLNETS